MGVGWAGKGRGGRGGWRWAPATSYAVAVPRNKPSGPGTGTRRRRPADEWIERQAGGSAVDLSDEAHHHLRHTWLALPRDRRRKPVTIHGIAHVQVAITAGGEDAARAFYTGLLGMPELSKPGSLADRGGCWFACGPQEVHCGVEEVVAPTRRHPAFLTDGLDTLKSRLESAGVPTATDRELPGYRRFYATDPFGNRLEFLQPM